MFSIFKRKEYLPILFLLLLGFFLRIILIKQALFGDITIYAEWGYKLWQLGAKNFYYATQGWLIGMPVYPPLAVVLFSSAYWLSEHAYVLAQIHNTIRIIPASFIVFFGKIVPLDVNKNTYGYFLLLKLIPILSDLGISVTIFYLIKKYTASYSKALLGFCFYLFNPITIFLSGVWGQLDSIVALFSFISFYMIYIKKPHLGLPLFFIGFFIKPNWAYLIPLFVFMVLVYKPSLRKILTGIILSASLFLFSTIPFSLGSYVDFLRLLFFRMIPVGVPVKLSVSAFNFYTIFSQINLTEISSAFFYLALVLYLIIIVLAFRFLAVDKKHSFENFIFAMFMVAFGTFLFMPNMLERYFFPALVPLAILLGINFRKYKWSIVVSLILFANLVWSFYRRSSDEISRPFLVNNALVIRLLSIFLVLWYLKMTNFVLKFMRGTGWRASRAHRGD